MTNPITQFRITSCAAVMQLVAKIAPPLEGEPTGDAVAASLVLAYLSITDDTTICEDAIKMKKLIEDLSLFLSLWDDEGKPN